MIKESLKEIKKEEDERKIERIYGKVEQMEREQKEKKNVVVYNLPESKMEEARERYRENEEACRTIFEGIEVQQVEQKPLIRLGKEKRTRPDQYWLNSGKKKMQEKS